MAEAAACRRLLEAARELVESGWCQDAEARCRAGEPVEPWDPAACSWSLLGALVAALEQEAALRAEVSLDELARALAALAQLVDDDRLARWNDAPGRSQAQVVETLAAAASACDAVSARVFDPSLN